MANVSLIPDPSILIKGLRDTGYDFNTSLADVIDNSVDAGASIIDIRILRDSTSGELTIMVADDGCGMDQTDLLNGMKYGSSSVQRDPRRLGKFGLGLKTASTAFCRQLSVVSKAQSSDPLLMATWDLDHVAINNSWDLILDTYEKIPSGYIRIFDQVVTKGHGTLVVWRKVDRLSAKSSKDLEKLVKSATSHLSMIFHRYLDPNFKESNTIIMKLNGTTIEPWDPFCRDTGLTEVNLEDTKEVIILDENGNEKKSSFHLCAYTIPHREELEDKGEKARITNYNMGFFVYRENRMIAFADWLGLRTKDYHDSLSRIEFSFDHTLDSAFSIDIKKSKITLNPELADWLQKWSAPAVTYANEKYRRKRKEKIGETSAPAHRSSDKNIQNFENDLVNSVIHPISEIDEATGIQTVEISNANTKENPLTIRIIVPDDNKPGITIFPDQGNFEGDVLWSPTFKNGHHAVRLNVDHPFYQKIYVPNHRDGVIMDGLDSLFWSLSEAENKAKYNQKTAQMFEDMRIDVSRSLKRLVEDLDEPEVG